MLFLLHVLVYIIALGIGSLGRGYFALYLGFLLICVSLFFNRKLSFLLGGLLLFGTLGWNIGNAPYKENIYNWEYLYNITHGYSTKSILQGTIEDIAYQSDFTSTYRLKIDKIDTISTQKNNILLFVEVPKNLTIHQNDHLEFAGKIMPTITYPLTGFERYAWKDSIFGKVSITGFEVLDTGKVTRFDKTQTWSEKIIFHGFPRDTAALILGMTIGNTNLLHTELKKDFMYSGMTHILVVSGSNIAFVILLILFFLKYTRANVWIRMTTVIFFVLLYSNLVGWEAPVIRATCMGIITYIALQWNLKISSLTLLFFIGAVYLSFYPSFLLYDAGFGLSFGATFGILYFHTKILKYLNSHGIYSVLSEILSITIGAMLGSLPVMIFQFGTISMGGIIANILIAPILGPLLFLGVGYMTLASLGVTQLYLAGLFVYFPAKIILIITSFFAGGSQIIIPEYLQTILPLILLGYYILLFLGSELTSLNEKDRIRLKHPEEDLILPKDQYQHP